MERVAHCSECQIYYESDLPVGGIMACECGNAAMIVELRTIAGPNPLADAVARAVLLIKAAELCNDSTLRQHTMAYARAHVTRELRKCVGE